jgi:TATA-binding protein-associated factor Taf7
MSDSTSHPFFTSSRISYTENAIKQTDSSCEHGIISSNEESTTRSEHNLFDISRILSNDDESLSSDSDMSLCSFDDGMEIDLDEESHFDRPRTVHFALDVVTEVRFRPKTEPNEVAILYSNPVDWDR